MNNWHQHTQGNKSAKEYVEKFNEFLIKAQILLRFRASLTDDFRAELLVKGVYKLKAAYMLVQDLDFARITHTPKSHDYRVSVSRPSSYPQPDTSSTQTPSHRDDVSVRVLNGITEIRALESSKVSSTTKCYKC